MKIVVHICVCVVRKQYICTTIIKNAKIMATIKAFIRTTVKTDTANVRFRLTDGRDFQVFHKSTIVVNPEYWDEKGQCIKAKVVIPNKKKIDDSVSDRKRLISDIYEKVGKTLTSDLLDTEIDKHLHPEKYIIAEPAPDTVLEYIQYFISNAHLRKHKKTGIAINTNNVKQYKNTQKHLIGFAKSIKKKDFKFSDINTDFYQKFVTYLQGLQFTQNTIGKHIKNLKIVFNQAKNADVDLKDFYVFMEDIDSVYLNETELQQLKDFDFSKDMYLDRVRDWFLLLAWTGCRFSDLMKIQRTDIKGNTITFRQQKTNTKVTIPLHPVVISILDKYSYQIPEPISNQKFNDYIKEVCKLAGIDSNETFTRTVGGKLTTEIKPKYELVSSHTGRRSFCTNMYKRELPTLMIMSISGHKTEKSFLKYIKVKQEEHAEMMAKRWREIYK